MIAIQRERSTIYAKNQPQYLPLPCQKKSDGHILIEWKLSFYECIKLLLTGILYHEVATFNNPLQPIKLSVNYPESFKNPYLTEEQIDAIKQAN